MGKLIFMQGCVQDYSDQFFFCKSKQIKFSLKKITLEFRIDGTPRLLIIPFFATLRNLIQHSPFINFGEFCQPPLLLQTPRFLIHVNSQQRQREAQAKPQNCLLYMLFLPHRTKQFSDYNEARSSVKRRIEQKNK